jgi:hypothetical protein
MADLTNSTIYGEGVVTRALSNGNYTSGFAGGGWRIDQGITTAGKSTAVFDNLSVRGTFNVYEMLINQIRATNGSVFISSTGKVDTVTGTDPTYTVTTVQTHGFAVGDIIKAQRVDGINTFSSVLTITSVTPPSTFVATRTSGTAPISGYEYVRIASSVADRQGSIYMTADDTGSPFIDVKDGASTEALFNNVSTTTVRIGKLTGITDTAIQATALTGYGLYADNVFLRGKLVAESGYIGTKAAGWTISSNAITGGNARLRASGILSLGTGDGWATANCIYIDGTTGNGRMSIGANFTYTGDALSAGGWTIASNQLSSNSMTINSATPYIGFGTTTYADTAGIWIGKDSTLWKLRIGNNFNWNGSNLSITGAMTITGAAIGGWTISDTTIQPSDYASNGGVILTSGTAGASYIKLDNQTSGYINLNKAGISVYNSTPTQIVKIGSDGSGWFGAGTSANAIEWTTGGVVSIADWTINASTITSGNMTLGGGATPYIKVGTVTSATNISANTGVYIDNSGNLLASGGSSNYIQKSGAVITLRGSSTSSVGFGATAINTGDGVYFDGGGDNFRVGNASASRLLWTGANIEIYNSSNTKLVSLGATNTIANWQIGTDLRSSDGAIILDASNKFISVNDNAGISIAPTTYTTWTANTAYALNTYVIPSVPNGYIYKCTTAGTSAATQPIWDTTVDGVTSDGATLKWTCRREESMFWAGSTKLNKDLTPWEDNGPSFKVTKSGQLYAKNAYISGTAANSIGIGYGVTSFGQYDIGIGYQAMGGSTLSSTGAGNVAMGYRTLYSKTTGNSNIGIGTNALQYTTNGSYNIGIGTSALENNGSGGYSIAIGYQAMYYANSNVVQRWMPSTTYVEGQMVDSASYEDYIFVCLVGGTSLATEPAWVTTVGSSTQDGTSLVWQCQPAPFRTYNTAIGFQALKGSNTPLSNIGTANTAIGYQVLLNNTKGSNNVAIGIDCLQGNTEGDSNVGIGNNVLYGNTTGGFNIAIGNESLFTNTQGYQNVGIGCYTLNANTIGDFNIAMGYAALSSNTTGNLSIAIGHMAMGSMRNAGNSLNVAIGYQALMGSSNVSNNTGTGNVALGFQALHSNSTGYSNVGIGASALFSNSTGWCNVGIGACCLQSNTVGTNNIGIGVSALNENTSGGNNVALGWDAMYNNTTGYSNVGIGTQALSINKSGYANVGIGVSALEFNTTGISNIGIGTSAMNSNCSKSGTIAIGYNAMYYANDLDCVSWQANHAYSSGIYMIPPNGYYYQCYVAGTSGAAQPTTWNTTIGGTTPDGTGSLVWTCVGTYPIYTYNTAIGYEALKGSSTPADNTGSENTALGYQVLMNNTWGGANVAIGSQCLEDNTSGTYNVGVGAKALNSNQAGQRSVAVGYQAMYHAYNGSSFFNACNTAVGFQALCGSATASSNSGIKNTALGCAALAVNTSGSNNIAIGYNAGSTNTTGSNQVFLGNSNITSTYLYGNVGIGTETPNFTLDIAGNARIRGAGYLYFGGTGASDNDTNLYRSAANTLKTDDTFVAAYVGVTGTTNTAGYFYAGSTTPTGSTRLNYSGYFYPTYINLAASADTTTAASHYFVETGSDGYVRPKTLANVKTEILSGLTLTAATDGFTIAGGTTSRTLTVTGANKSLSGTGTGITLTGAYGLTFTMSGTTSLTLPTSGTVTALGNSTTGSGSIVRATSPTLITPSLGAATATSINGLNLSLGGGSFDTNVALGVSTLYCNVSGSSNIGVGYYALYRNTTGYNNVGIGSGALRSNTTGIFNMAVGSGVLYCDTTGSYNVGLGDNCLYNNTDGTYNVAIGSHSLYFNASCYSSTAVGYQAMYYANNIYCLPWQATTAYVVGQYMFPGNGYYFQCITAGTSGSSQPTWNTDDMNTNTTDGTVVWQSKSTYPIYTYNTAFGYQALFGGGTPSDNTGTGNTAIGHSSLHACTSGYNNVALGSMTLVNNTSGYNNVAIGAAALYNNTTGSNNIAINNIGSNVSNTVWLGNNLITTTNLYGSVTAPYLTITGTTPTAGYFYAGATAPTDTTRLNYNGYFYATRVYNAVFNDYAEYFDKDGEAEAGDVIIANPEGDGFVKASTEYDTKVVGVYSDEYAQCIGGNGDGEDEENFIPVGLAGKVRVKVTGPIKKGDLLVSSNVAGHAMASQLYQPGTVIGKALEAFNGCGTGKIKMFIMNC